MSNPEERPLKKKLSFVQKIEKYFDDSKTDIMINEATIGQPQFQIKRHHTVKESLNSQPEQFKKDYQLYHNDQPLDQQPELDTQHK